MTLIVQRMDAAGVSTGWIVQTWGEAATNPAVRRVANEFYVSAFDFLREYLTIWLTTSQAIDLRSAREQAVRQSRLMISLVYAHILQDALIDGHDNQALADTLTVLQQTPTPASAPGSS